MLVGAGMWRNRIVLGTDGSRFSDAAAVSAAKIADCCTAPITVVSALVPSHSPQRQQEGRETVERTLAQFMRDELVLGSVSERAIGKAKCAVLVVRA